MDVDAKKLQDTIMEDAALATTAVCGSSCYSAAAAADAVTAAACSAADAATTAVCGSSFFLSSAADAASVTDVAVDATANLL